MGGFGFFFSFFILLPPSPRRGGGVGKRGRRGRLSPVCWLVRQWGVRVSVGSTAPWLREVESRVARRRAQSTRVPPPPPPALQRGWTAVLPGRGFGCPRSRGKRAQHLRGPGGEMALRCREGGRRAGVWGPQAFRCCLVSTTDHLG